VAVPAGLVAEVAADRRVSPSRALELLIDDAVAAGRARANGLDRSPPVARTVTAVAARAVVDRVRREARAHPPKDDEVVELSQRHWIELDLPETVRVVHAVARRSVPGTARDEQAAKAVATAIAVAVAGAGDEGAFMANARAVSHPGVEVTVESLEPVTADGRVAAGDGSGRYDVRFSAAASTLQTVGVTSGVVETSAGWHVIRLLERRPGHTLAFDERRRLLAEEIYAGRAQAALDEVLARRRDAEDVSLANGVDELMGLVSQGFSEPRTTEQQPGTP
jgi:hypothetical protein